MSVPSTRAIPSPRGARSPASWMRSLPRRPITASKPLPSSTAPSAPPSRRAAIAPRPIPRRSSPSSRRSGKLPAIPGRPASMPCCRCGCPGPAATSPSHRPRSGRCAGSVSPHHRPPFADLQTAGPTPAVRAHHARHPAQAPDPRPHPALECHHARLHRGRSRLPFGQLDRWRVSPVPQSHRHPWSPIDLRSAR